MDKTVTDMLELIRPDIELFASIVAERPAPCQSNHHPDGLFGHVPDQPASFLVGLPCGRTLLMCEGWVARTQVSKNIICNGGAGCGSKHPVSTATFTRLPN